MHQSASTNYCTEDGISSTTGFCKGTSAESKWSGISVSSGSTNDYRMGTQPNMSFCIAIGYSNQVYFAVDSRSSILRTEKRLVKKKIASHILSDDFQKLFYTNGVAIMVTGVDTFSSSPSGKRITFSDILKSISFQSCDNPQKAVQLIIDTLGTLYTFKLEKTFLTFLYFDKERGNLLHSVSVTSTETESRFCKEDDWALSASPSDNNFCFFMSGTDWAQEVARYFPFSTSNDDKTACKKLNDLMGRILTVSELIDNSVGGTIRIAKLTPDGFTWLQGEPT